MRTEHQNLSAQQKAHDMHHYKSFFHKEFLVLFAALNYRILLQINLNFRQNLSLCHVSYEYSH